MNPLPAGAFVSLRPFSAVPCLPPFDAAAALALALGLAATMSELRKGPVVEQNQAFERALSDLLLRLGEHASEGPLRGFSEYWLANDINARSTELHLSTVDVDDLKHRLFLNNAHEVCAGGEFFVLYDALKGRAAEAGARSYRLWTIPVEPRRLILPDTGWLRRSISMQRPWPSASSIRRSKPGSASFRLSHALGKQAEKEKDHAEARTGFGSWKKPMPPGPESIRVYDEAIAAVSLSTCCTNSRPRHSPGQLYQLTVQDR